jgi:hypothetical protein
LITVFISRHINYPSDFWKIVFLIVVIFIEAYTADKVVNGINKKEDNPISASSDFKALSLFVGRDLFRSGFNTNS